MTYVPNKWITYVLTISPFGNLWQNHNKQMRYKRSHESLNSYSLVEYNKIYHSTNSWKSLQEKSLWQVDLDNLYFWNTLNKTHQGMFVWNRNNRLHTSYKNPVYKERKETTYVRIGERNIHQHIKKISTMYINNGHKTHVQDINVSKKEKRKRYKQSSLHPSVWTLPLTKISYANPPSKYDYSHNQNYFPFLS